MVLSEQQARGTIESPNSKKLIETVKQQESQLRVFTQEMTSQELQSESYWNGLVYKLHDRSEQKFEKIMKYFRYPLPVVQLTDSILNDYYKVFDGKNRAFSVNADRETERLNSWIENNSPDKWIEDQAREVLKCKPISFVVVDVDKNGNPYGLLIDAERLVDVVFKNKEGDLEYITFIHSKENLVSENGESTGVLRTYYGVYDDENYYVFYKDSNSDFIVLHQSSVHQVGYCPAKSFISRYSNEKNLIYRSTIFGKALSKLEDWLIFDVFRNYVDHYAPFPITESPARECSVEGCNDGFITEEVVSFAGGKAGETRYIQKPCKVCQENKFTPLPGTNIEIPISSDPKLNNASGIFKMIMPDVDGLQYVPKKLDDLEVEIRYKTVGVNQLLNKEAVNEMQTKGSFASMETILIESKKQLDEAYKFYVGTVAKLFYNNIRVEVEANFGTEFYLLSEEELQTRYEKAKSIGLPAEEQLNIYRQLVETKYKGNSVKLRRTLMLLDLDPFPMYSLKECFEMKKEGVINNFDLTFKINFLKFIAKFEAENIIITDFGSELEYWQRIEKINEELIKYTEQLILDRDNRIKESSNTDEQQPVIEQPVE